jgi:hypothetical protein
MRHPCPDLRCGSAGSHRLARCPLKRLLDLHDGADRWDEVLIYQNHMKLTKESEFHEMSYHEKRKKDKSFGRFVKSVKKHKNR